MRWKELTGQATEMWKWKSAINFTFYSRLILLFMTRALATRNELNLKSLKRENFPARYANKARGRAQWIFLLCKASENALRCHWSWENRFRAPPRALKWICDWGRTGKRKFITSRVRRVATVVECRERENWKRIILSSATTVKEPLNH